MGLFRRLVEEVGQKTEPSDALGPSLIARARWDDGYDGLLDSVRSCIADFETVFDVAQCQQQFTEQKRRHEHVRLLTEIRFFGAQCMPDNACFYIVHPESDQLLRVVKAMRCRRTYRNWMVWVSDYNEPIELKSYHLCYVSDEPNVAGKTLDEIRGRYANINT